MMRLTMWPVFARARQRAREESGAAMVEFAVVAPLLMLLAVGIVSVGLTFHRQVTITHAAREGARFGATHPVPRSGVTDAWLDAVADAAVQAGTGELATTIDGRVLCVAYIGYAPIEGSTTDWTRRRMQVEAGTPAYTSGSVSDPTTWCFDDGKAAKPTERRVQVVTGRDSQFDIFLWRETLKLRNEGVARFEAVYAG